MPTTTALLLIFAASAAGAASKCSWDPATSTLDCQLKWEDVDLVLDFAKHQREATSTLKLTCSTSKANNRRLRVNYNSGRLRRAANPWPHLHTVQISNCPLASIRIVLDGLQVSRNDDVFRDVIQPLLGGRSLHGIRNMALTNDGDGLDLSSTLWCDLGTNLVQLNLSGNGLNRVPNPINASSCQSLQHLEVLNLANNKISLIDQGNIFLTMASASLTHLDLSHNRLQSLALPTTMATLKIVDVSENRLASSAQLFEAVSASAKTLQELHAQGNNMESLPPPLTLDSLVVLNMSRNDISLQGGEAMAGLRQLVALDLSHNRLSGVDDHLLRDLSSLQVLSLAHNQLKDLSTNALATLTRLHVLVLSNNNLDEKGLSEGVFRHMSDLRSLSLDHNRLRSVPSDLLRGCSSLKDLALAANFLRHWPLAALKPVSHHLHTLDIGENSLRELQPLEGFKQLYGLRLAGNRLRNITEDIFAESPHIRMLNVASNLVEHIDQNAFEALKHLKALRLDNNRLEDINGLLTVQHHLQWLNVSHNHLQWFDYALIPKSVIWLSLRHNRIEELGNYYNMQEGFHLTHLDIGHNALVRMDRQALQASLKEIYADHNEIGELAANMFSDLTNLSLVNLTHNKLQKFALSSLALSLHHGSTLIWLSDNPLVCDCEMEWIQRINTLATTSPREFPMVGDWPDLRCRLNNRAVTGEDGPRSNNNNNNNSSNHPLVVSDVFPVASVRPSEFLCPYETHCFALCRCCDFFACDCRMKCSDGCSCFHDQTWSSNIIECGNREHKTVPEFIPMDATSVYLDGNGFQTDALINDEFIGRKHLTALYLNGSSIAVVSNQTFKGLTELLVLHLGDNGLTSLDDGQEFDELVSLRELYLHNNALEFIHEDTLKPLMPTLQILTLHGNRLKVDFHVWEYMGPRLRSLSLGANDWSCQCDFVQKFQMALKASPAGLTVVDADDIKCFKEETNSSSCADVLAVSFRSGGDSLWSSWDSLVPVVAVTVASMIIVISLIILAVAARKPLNSWFQRRYGGIQRSTIYGTMIKKTNRYDVLVFAAPVDEDFVRQTLVGLLEAQNYRVCLHPLRSETAEKPPVEVSASVCVVASQSSYIQKEATRPHDDDLVVVSKLCRDHAKPLVFVALETATAKALRRLPAEMKATKVLLWDTKSFWPTLRSIIPSPPTVSNSISPTKAVNHDTEDEDMWTYLKSSSNKNNGSGDSSLSTQSTDTMLASRLHPKRASTLRTAAATSSQPHQACSYFNSPATLHSRRMMQQSQAVNSRRIRTNIVENPLAAVAATTGSHHRSLAQQGRRQQAEEEEEPIYHSLDDEAVVSAAGDAVAETDGDVTVYINADLEVVYPSISENEGAENDDDDDDDEAELNGLLADCYENEDSLFANNEYVPSPAPGSYPRNHLSSSYAAAASNISRRQQQQPQRGRGYLV